MNIQPTYKTPSEHKGADYKNTPEEKKNIHAHGYNNNPKILIVR